MSAEWISIETEPVPTDREIIVKRNTGISVDFCDSGGINVTHWMEITPRNVALLLQDFQFQIDEHILYITKRVLKD